MAAVGLGFAISFKWHLALGPTIVTVASIIFAASLARRA
jgi:ABC-type Mn2+/Zn2+ transport system permease subunit